MAKRFHILHHIKPKLVLIGGGGHARACIDVIEKENRFKICGIVDSNALQNGISEVLGYPILGGDELLESLYTQVKIAFIALGQIKTPTHRMRIYQNLKTIGYNLPTIISPLAYIAKGVNLKEGSIIMHHALVNANAKIGTACIINSKALVEHDCVVEDFCHLSTASVINGNCHIGEGSFLGSNMILAHNTAVAPNSLLYNNPLEVSQNISGISPSLANKSNSQSSLQESTTHYSNKNLSLQIDKNLTGGGDRVKYLYPCNSSFSFFRFQAISFYPFSKHITSSYPVKIAV
ncbi:acetyl transferase [Helicobacter cinaedi CCUG 18818 = ATCC BAA-847]|uniref:Acetyl transferase n=1 Tax=Helicobacter cinaedi CCUG 18818 = ATCC BAA-847 TaxID=537971 RepID=A0AAI8MM10_9HELI|nr:NeuD/PglB/VioB family sugar acetyltransferase [Helicobacter cinaedi]BAM32078.1 acetyl transferase [Helicobacter cinaedi CCUG 18818 = ATCC BAA-847]